MGMDLNVLGLLGEAKQGGASFAKTLTLGRQTGHVSTEGYRRLARRFGATEDLTCTKGQPLDESGILAALLGVDELVSMDYSDFEGASIRHDLNVPVPETLHNEYDAVIDGGTLEHVFHFPNAIANCMRMVRPGGRFFAITMANNLCGHGFYQFSFELYFRVFNSANGFDIENMYAMEYLYPGTELSPRARIYSVQDPAKLGTRVGLTNRKPIVLFVQARKVEDKVPCLSRTYQSDYVAHWSQTQSIRPRPLRGFVRSLLPEGLRNHLSGIRQRRKWSLSNREFYTRR